MDNKYVIDELKGNYFYDKNTDDGSKFWKERNIAVQQAIDILSGEVMASGEVVEVNEKFGDYFKIGDKEFMFSEFPGWFGKILRKYRGGKAIISINKMKG